MHVSRILVLLGCNENQESSSTDTKKKEKIDGEVLETLGMIRNVIEMKNLRL